MGIKSEHELIVELYKEIEELKIRVTELQVENDYLQSEKLRLELAAYNLRCALRCN